MSKIIIGIDPDSKAHGVAVYYDGVLEELHANNFLDLQFLINEFLMDIAHEKLWPIEIHIEDVNGVSAAFGARDKKSNINIKLKIAQHIGMCKQSQIEIERLAESLDIKVVKHKISKMWKKDKAQFEKITGWSGRSNEDTRSAAYFGWLGCR